MKISDLKYFKPITLVTHAGVFHSDDVLATVVLREFLEWAGVKEDQIKLVRTYHPAEEGYHDDSENVIVYDIGLGQYDHHQIGKAARHTIKEDGSKYAAVGLIWKEIGSMRLTEESAKYVEKNLIKYVDDHDNGNGRNPLSSLISAFNPANGKVTDRERNEAFEAACEAVSVLYKKMIERCEEDDKQNIRLLEYIKNNDKCIKDKHYLVTDEFFPTAIRYCRNNNIPFYIFPNPRQEGSYSFQTVTRTEDGDINDHLCDIPEEIRNKEGVTFLHPTRFIGSAVSKQRAIELVIMCVIKAIKESASAVTI